ncbi:hypothetical protein GGR54DRAFT_329864 [Hypoxylon sp. NC1633]|nr:hypothetical protein GGR54DRAFT_329864 [Hypoxylon sp. NC1633]
MPATEASYLASSTPGAISPAFRDLAKAGIALQGEWCVANAPWLTSDRGAALFQQLEDAGITLIVAHWDSFEQHQACIASPGNQAAFVDWMPHLDLTAIKPGHIDGVRLFPRSEDEEELIPALEAPVLAVTTWTVLRENVKPFEEAMDTVKELWDTATLPYRHRGGWRIEKDGEVPFTEQFIVIGGVESTEKGHAIAKGEAWDKYSRDVLPFALSVDIKYYRRIV